MSGAVVIATFALRESVRRRVFTVVGLLTLAFLALYGLGTWQRARSRAGARLLRTPRVRDTPS